MARNHAATHATITAQRKWAERPPDGEPRGAPLAGQRGKGYVASCWGAEAASENWVRHMRHRRAGHVMSRDPCKVSTHQTEPRHRKEGGGRGTALRQPFARTHLETHNSVAAHTLSRAPSSTQGQEPGIARTGAWCSIHRRLHRLHLLSMLV
jgi:hypothetical protein